MTPASNPPEFNATAAAADNSATGLNTPVTLGGLRFLAHNGVLNANSYESALKFLGLRPNAKSWAVYWLRILLTTGLLFCIAGIICFLAFNWAAMPHFLKFGIVIALMLICGGIALWRGPDSLSGGLSLLACGLLAGPLLAVYGQYYQTGADAWELFRAWTIFLLLLALAGRQNALWLAVWLVGSLWAVLGIYQLYIFSWASSPKDVLPLTPFLASQLAVLIIWEAAVWLRRNRPASFLRSAWPARVVALCLLVLLTIINVYNIVEASSSYRGMPGSLLVQVLAYAALLAGGFVWYRRKRPDTLLLACGMLSLVVMLYAFMLSRFSLNNAAGMLFYALLLMGLAVGIVRLTLRWHQQNQRLGLETVSKADVFAHAWRQIMFMRQKSLARLYTRLNITQDNGAGNELAQNPTHAMPWYLKLLIILCAWVAAVFLIVCIVFIINTVSRHYDEHAALVFSVILIALAAVLVRTPVMFFRQFALAMALAGALLMPVALIFILDMDSFFEIPILLTCAVCFLCVKHPAMRAFAFFGVFNCLIILWLRVYAELDMFFMSITSHLVIFLPWFKIIVLSGMFAIVVCVMLYLWLTENRWVTNKTADEFIRPALTGLIAGFIGLGILSVLYYGSRFSHVIWLLEELFYWNINIWLAPFSAGLGCAVGLIFMAHKLLKTRTGLANTHKAAIYAGGVICLIAGWWLPWLPAGLLFLALARYTGNVALAGLSAAYLVFFVLWYYFMLQIGLLYKAYTLLGAGVIMLAAGLLVYHLFYNNKNMQGAANA